MSETHPERDKWAELNTALAEAQGAFPAISKDRTVTVRPKTSAPYSYSYATLSGILAAVRPALKANGLALVQLLEDDGRGTCLRTELRHAGGAVLAASFPLPQVPPDPQALGSLLTYLRRYAITAILGIAADEDDDGAAAKAPDAAKQPERRRGTDSAEGGRAEASGEFKPPAPKPGPGVADLVAEVQHRFDTLRKLEAQLTNEPRDWSAWSRRKVGLRGDAMGSADDYRKAIEALAAEEARLIGELAAKTAAGG